MIHEPVKLLLPFDVLVDSITQMGINDKRRLWEVLEEQMAQAEEELWERDSTIQAEIREARSDYEKGDFVTFDEYIAQQRPAIQ